MKLKEFNFLGIKRGYGLTILINNTMEMYGHLGQVVSNISYLQEYEIDSTKYDNGMFVINLREPEVTNECRYRTADGKCECEYEKNSSGWPKRCIQVNSLKTLFSDGFEIVELDEVCAKSPPHVSFHFLLHKSDIEALQTGKILHDARKYGVFLRLADEDVEAEGQTRGLRGMIDVEEVEEATDDSHE